MIVVVTVFYPRAVSYDSKSHLLVALLTLALSGAQADMSSELGCTSISQSYK
jgi:hypothetical protein